MNLHEYQAKSLLSQYGVKIAQGIMAETPESAVSAAKELQKNTGTRLWVVKAQIHAGGRGKGGGVKVAKTLEDVFEKSKAILGMKLVSPQTGPEGKLVRKILIAEDVYYPGEKEPKEFYMSILLDRSTGKNIIMASTEGGVEIEAVAAKTPEKIFKEWIEPSAGLRAFQCRKIAFSLGCTGKEVNEMISFIKGIYQCYEACDASLVEINPVLRTSDGQILAVDAKIKLDDNAMFRHNDFPELRDIHEEDPLEVEASLSNLNYIKLDGNVGCMVNGAGLAMATMDMIKLAGGHPANFLDVGGSASVETVEAGFRIILKDPNVKAILINIFGGIVRCDRVAGGVVQAYKNIGNVKIPIIVRLQGTNAEMGAKIIEDSGLKVTSAILLKDAAERVADALKN
ncbi:MAG: succinate--CoA ligase subunit beta [Bacteroidetes bacterium RIFCSPLOWO2_12_FULL_37_12]|nr:MAG: succinate--CoA ligase subunit beta [Bacteroidetes bacterium RIFCSPLOWO2_12_FULL_37_12]